MTGLGPNCGFSDTHFLLHLPLYPLSLCFLLSGLSGKGRTAGRFPCQAVLPVPAASSSYLYHLPLRLLCCQVSKISDFGLASTLIDGATHRSTQTMGTISHSAPEVLTTGRLSPAADVYSFGIMSKCITGLLGLLAGWCKVSFFRAFLLLLPSLNVEV